MHETEFDRNFDRNQYKRPVRQSNQVINVRANCVYNITLLPVRQYFIVYVKRFLINPIPKSNRIKTLYLTIERIEVF